MDKNWWLKGNIQIGFSVHGKVMICQCAWWRHGGKKCLVWYCGSFLSVFATFFKKKKRCAETNVLKTVFHCVDEITWEGINLFLPMLWQTCDHLYTKLQIWSVPNTTSFMLWFGIFCFEHPPILTSISYRHVMNDTHFYWFFLRIKI